MADMNRAAIAQIYVDVTKNSRLVPNEKKYPELFKKYQAKLNDLAGSIAKEGQLIPVNVVPTKRPGYAYELVAGYRRMAALKLLGKETVFIKVDEFEKETDRKVANLAENVAREDLSAYELAVACRDLRDSDKLSANEISKRIGANEGMSKGYINNLMRILDKCPDKVLAAWIEGHPQATVDKLLKVAAKGTKDEQLELWAEYIGENDDEEGEGEEGEGEEGEGGGKKKAKRATEANLVAALAAVKAALPRMMGESEKAGAIAALEFALGRRKVLKVETRVVYDPKQAKKDEKAESKKVTAQ